MGERLWDKLKKKEESIQIEGLQSSKDFDDYTNLAIRRSNEAKEFSPQAQNQIIVRVPDDIIVNFIADVHAFHPTTDHERLRQELDVIKKTRNSYVIFGGDLVEGVFWGGASMEQVGSLDNQKGFLREMFKMMKGKTIGAVSGEHDCIDNKTEALTKRGWLTYDKVKKTDEFLTINPQTGFLEWHKYKHFHKYSVNDLEMVKIKTRDFDFFGTDNHRFFIQGRRNKKFGFVSALEYSQRIWGNEFIPMSSTFGLPDYKISDNLIGIMAWVIADGWVEWKDKRIRVGQRVEKSHYLRELLDKERFEYSECKTKPNVCGDIIDGKTVKSRKPFMVFELKGRMKEKLLKILNGDKHQIPEMVWKFSDRQFDIFMENFVLADGTFNGRDNSYLIFQKSRKFIDDIQALCAMHNKRTTIYEYKNSYGKQLRINVCKRNGMRFNSPKLISKLKKYTGIIWDITVKNGNFLVRRNGKEYFTGNSKWAAKTGADPYTDFQELTKAPYKRGLLEIKIIAGNQDYTGIVAHKLRGNSIYTNVHPAVRAGREIQGHDFYFGGHTHRKGLMLQAVRDKNGAHSVAFGISGPYKEEDEYTQRSGWISQKTKQLYGFAVRFNPDTKRIEIDEDIVAANKRWG